MALQSRLLLPPHCMALLPLLQLFLYAYPHVLLLLLRPLPPLYPQLLRLLPVLRAMCL